MKIGADDPQLGEEITSLYRGADRFSFVDAPPARSRAATVVVRVILYAVVLAALIGGLAVFVEIVRRNV